MARRILYGVLLVGLVYLCYIGYVRYRQNRAMLSGDVTSGPSESLPAEAPTTRPTEPRRRPPVDTPEESLTTPTSAPATATAPATDSQSANAPEGTRIAGAGRFQVYRQGNLTYRLDTESGRTCVLYATQEEWRKPEVYRHGCGNGTTQ